MRLFIIVILLICNSIGMAQSFETGNTVLISDEKSLISGNKLGVITNRTGVDRNGRHIVDLLIESGQNVVKIFTPEHGFSADDTYSISGIKIPVVSLYGNKYSFSKNDVEDVDILIFDIQELGARFYTYTSTLYLTMQDAKKYGKKYIVCDRPAVANPNNAEGFQLEGEFSSFVGKVPTPVITGLTIGELGEYLNKYYVKYEDFVVVKMKGYTRNIMFEDAMKVWVNPSPSITSIESARIYPALCFLEGTNISEGRGTATPLQVFGAPFIDSDVLSEKINSSGLKGIRFEKTEFVPEQSLLPLYTAMKYAGKKCYGLKIIITDFKLYKPFETSVAVLIALKESAPEFKWTNKNFIDKLAGTDKLRKMIDSNKSLSEIINSTTKYISSYNEDIKSCLLY